mmetsp:Transcript_19834/g.43041  ORF Transcript_19834/g.43041 Transcript_19834/m.43041 type:complete len:381 (-) Transcript_19834:1772-2914(-)|eukprot:CAMPEP_0168164802 /NCGR_PEP_ID=MMETSP0139_2-20121125/1137_1 /TAXON_ID=44445 /ORGANISM="Pseudo-nitzschia australis, Strain 10249 10 AB" /LENGTH=380 /DNA_ID=CAMNT_0008081855 /DNA_START=117 /DNA_END=1259 /DNA_ORIENTATION=-
MTKKSEPRRILSDSELVERIDDLVKEEKHLEASRLIRKIQNPSLVSESHRKLLNKARIVERAVGELLSSPQEEWIKQGEAHGRYDFTIYYKVEDGARLTCRIESPIPCSLMVPLLGVLNESALYRTWTPSWRIPFKLGLQESNQLLHDSRGHQVVQFSLSSPWPMHPREVLVSIQAIDDIDRNGFIVATITTIDDTEEGEMVKKTLPSDFDVPETPEGMERCDFNGAVLFRSCPTDHPNYRAMQDKFPEEDLILIQFTMHVDAKMTMVPQSMVNFVTRTVLGVAWNMLLRVAEQVRDGHREEHCRSISEKVDFYRWVKERCDYMLHIITIGNDSNRNSFTTSGREQQQQNRQKEQNPAETQSEMKEHKHWTLQDVLRMIL